MPRTGYSAWRRRNIGAPNKKLDYGLICGDHRYPYWLRRLDFERTIAVFWIDNHEIMQNRVGKGLRGGRNMPFIYDETQVAWPDGDTEPPPPRPRRRPVSTSTRPW